MNKKQSQENKAVLELSVKQKESIAASKADVESGKMLENKLLGKEVRAWLKSR